MKTDLYTCGYNCYYMYYYSILKCVILLIFFEVVVKCGGPPGKHLFDIYIY